MVGSSTILPHGLYFLGELFMGVAIVGFGLGMMLIGSSLLFVRRRRLDA
jgi:hypothetical protein